MEEVAYAAKSKELELRDNIGSKSTGEGLYVRGRSETRNQQSGKNKSRARSKSRDSGKKICWICGKEGHYKKQCYKWLERNQHKVKSNGQGESAMVKDDAEDLVGLIASEVNLSEDRYDRDEWIMDTGCSFHMTPRREFFINFREINSGKVRMANNSHSDVKGICSIRFSNHDGTTFVLHDVRYMPQMSRNLISMGTLESKGCDFKGGNGVLKVVKGCTTIMKGIRQSSLYIFQGEARMAESLAVTSDGEQHGSNQTKLWHSRMGHVGQKCLSVLMKKGCFGKDKVS